MKIEGCTICVTGGNKGVGAEIVKQVVEKARKVFVIDRSEQIFYHEKVEYLKMDISLEKPVGLPFVDIFISNLGMSIGPKTMDEITDNDIEKMVEVNIKTHLWILKHVEFKKIVFISSVLSLIGMEKYSLYCASKAFLRILNESLQREGRDTLIVYPYKIDTTMFQEINDLWTLKASKVAARIIKGIEADQKEIYLPYFFKIAFILKTLLPSFLVNFVIQILVKYFYRKSVKVN